MPIDLSSLRKVEGVPEIRQAQPGNAAGPLLVLIKLHKGKQLPTYVAKRGEPAPGFFSAVIPAEYLIKLETDPAVASVAVSRAVNRID